MITEKEIKSAKTHDLDKTMWAIERELESRNAGIVCGDCGKRDLGNHTSCQNCGTSFCGV